MFALAAETGAALVLVTHDEVSPRGPTDGRGWRTAA